MTRVRDNSRKLNSGFTLIEVIIAVIILAIISIPLVRSFASAAQTSGKAAIKMKATTAAENLMEDIKGMTLEQVISKYGVGANSNPSKDIVYDSDLGKYEYNAKGGTVYSLEINKSKSSFDADLAKMVDDSTYDVTIEIDPTYYPNINTVNMADFNTVNSESSAIFCLTDTIDKQAYKEFVDLNSQMDAGLDNKTAADFEKLLKREIRVDIGKSGTFTDENGDTHDAHDVSVTVTYLAPNKGADKVVPDGREVLQKVSRQIYSESISKKKLESIYIMYPPRYEAANSNKNNVGVSGNGNGNGDIIIVHNRDDVEANLYIIAQNFSNASDKGKEYLKKNQGLNLQIYENEITDEVKGGTKQPLTLFTNLHDDTEYLKKDDSKLLPVKCNLNLDTRNKDPEGIKDSFDDKVYGKIVARTGKFADEDPVNSPTVKLNARDIDGKLLDASKVDPKIYDVKVTISKKINDADTEWPVTVELKGSITD